MKKSKRLFWVFSILFVALMLMSAFPEILILPESTRFMDQLGYPPYIGPFLGVAKLLGVTAILIPGFPRLKEWAYAGLLFDLLGALYSNIYVSGVQPQMVFFLLYFLTGGYSYFYFRKLTGSLGSPSGEEGTQKR